MLRPALIVTCLLGAGCNQVFGLEETQPLPGVGGGTDYDLDGIPDDRDPCIAAMLDESDDIDGDMLPSKTDPCPFDSATSANGNPDTDGDGVNDACDPFVSRAGDSHRCTMRFYNTDLNARLWRETDADMAWTSIPGMLYANDTGMPSSIAATIDLEKVAEPTFDASIYTAGDAFTVHGVRVWVRAADPASRDDLGCEIYGDRTYTRIAIAMGDGRDVGTPMTLSTPFPLGSQMRMQVTVIPASGTIRCTVSRFPDRWTVTATSPLPMGKLGFGIEGAQMHVDGLAIYDRTEVVALP